MASKEFSQRNKDKTQGANIRPLSLAAHPTSTPRRSARAARGMPELRLPITAPAAAGSRRHSRRLRRRCRLILLLVLSLAVLSLAYLSFSSHANLPIHGKRSNDQVLFPSRTMILLWSCNLVATDKGIRPQSVFCMCARRRGQWAGVRRILPFSIVA